MSDAILVPIDFSPSSEAAVRWAVKQAGLTGARLVLLHVVHEPNPAYELPTDDGVLGTLEQAARAATQAFIENLRRDCGDVVPIEGSVVVGTPAGRIIEVVEARGISHVVMGARGAGGLGERLLGSKAERVARLCQVPVTIVRA